MHCMCIYANEITKTAIKLVGRSAVAVKVVEMVVCVVSVLDNVDGHLRRQQCETRVSSRYYCLRFITFWVASCVDILRRTVISDP